MKFKTVAAASLAVATMFGMGACGSNSAANKTTSDGKTIITFWHNSTTGDGKAYFADVAKQFEASHKNVKIEIQAHHLMYSSNVVVKSCGIWLMPVS